MNRMMKPLYCIIDKHSEKSRDQKRESVILDLELDLDRIIPIFEEATQTAANLLQISISALGILIGDHYHIKSAYGLSNLGLSSDIVSKRKIPRHDSFAINVIDSNNCLVIENTTEDPFFSSAILTQHNHVMAYIGVPLIVNNGQCIGCLEVMDLQPRQFSQGDIDIVNMIARWCIAEYQYNQATTKPHLIKSSSYLNPKTASPFLSTNYADYQSKQQSELLSDHHTSRKNNSYSQKLSIQLINKLIQKLTIPLTSVIGMSSVLKQETYGKLNQKQIDYLNIVYNSGQEMTTLVEEINNLANFKPDVELQLAPVDLENLGNQVISSLENTARNRQQSLRLSIEPGEKIWQLDREKLKQTLYYLLLCIIEGARSGGEISLHISQQLQSPKKRSQDNTTKKQTLSIKCWVRHPWLGEGISFEKVTMYEQIIKETQKGYNSSEIDAESKLVQNYDYDIICLLFACYLISIQQGYFDLKGSSEYGYRFLLSLPI